MGRNKTSSIPPQYALLAMLGSGLQGYAEARNQRQAIEFQREIAQKQIDMQITLSGMETERQKTLAGLQMERDKAMMEGDYKKAVDVMRMMNDTNLQLQSNAQAAQEKMWNDLNETYQKYPNTAISNPAGSMSPTGPQGRSGGGGGGGGKKSKGSKGASAPTNTSRIPPPMTYPGGIVPGSEFRPPTPPVVNTRTIAIGRPANPPSPNTGYVDLTPPEEKARKKAIYNTTPESQPARWK